MSTTTLTFRFTAAGALADVASVVLRDATGTYGVVRQDTGAVVVAAGTPMSHVGTGLYEYVVSDPGPGLVYQWAAEYVYGGLTRHAVFTALGGASAAGFWTSQAAIERYAGVYNADTASNLDNLTTAADPAGYADAISRAEAFIDYWLTFYGYPNGTTSPTFPNDTSAYTLLATYVTILAYAYLQTKRGQFDAATKELAGKFGAAAEKAEREILAIVRGGIPGLTPVAGAEVAGTFVGIPVADPCAAACDENAACGVGRRGGGRWW